MSEISFAKAFRECTGKALTDSGDHYGRSWQEPPLAEDGPEIVAWPADCPATIETSAFLRERMEILPGWRGRYDRWSKAQEDKGVRKSDFEFGSDFMKARGYALEDGYDGRPVRGNVCNSETDLSQVFVYEVWRREPAEDWIYSDGNEVCVVYPHTGCDHTMGYAAPVFCRSKGDYAFPLDLRAEYYAFSGVGSDGAELEREALSALCEKWESGYSDNPYGMLSADVAEWHEETRGRDSVVVTLKTGERVWVVASAPSN